MPCIISDLIWKPYNIALYTRRLSVRGSLLYLLVSMCLFYLSIRHAYICLRVSPLSGHMS